MSDSHVRPKGKRPKRPTKPLHVPCSREFFGVKCGGSPQVVTTFVVHQTQSSGARGSAAYLHTRPDGSTHLVLDWDECFRLQDDNKTCCGVAGFNTGVVHVEMAGYSSWLRKVWLLPKNRRMTKRCAYKIARGLFEHDLPNRFLTVAELNAGARRGYTTHMNASLSNASTSDHTDPGPGFPVKRFQKRVTRYYREMR